MELADSTTPATSDRLERLVGGKRDGLEYLVFRVASVLMGNRKLAEECLSSKTTCELAMRYFHLQILAFFVGLSLVGCGSRGIPEPIKVLENPTTGERARFFREISYKVPKDYSETKHLADWSDIQDKAGFTREITLEDDRESLAELRKTNLAASRK